MKKLRSKKLKGMTLFEIIISIAIVAIMTVLLVSVSSTINSYIRSANNVNKRVAHQAPIAEVGKVAGAKQIESTVNIVFEYNSKKFELKAEQYAIEQNDSTPSDSNYRPGDGLNMKFLHNIKNPIIATSATAPSTESSTEAST